MAPSAVQLSITTPQPLVLYGSESSLVSQPASASTKHLVYVGMGWDVRMGEEQHLHVASTCSPGCQKSMGWSIQAQSWHSDSALLGPYTLQWKPPSLPSGSTQRHGMSCSCLLFPSVLLTTGSVHSTFIGICLPVV